MTTVAFLSKWHKQYGDVFGFFMGDAPFVAVKDLDLIRTIFIKDSQKFFERGTLMRLLQDHPLLEQNLIFAGASKWKSTRSCLTSAFSVAKMKTMMPAMHHAVDCFLNILDGYAERGQELDISEVSAQLTFDVIGKTAFGIDTKVQDSMDNPLYRAAIDAHPYLMSGAIHNLAQSFTQWPWLLRLLLPVIRLVTVNPLEALVHKVQGVVEFRRANPLIKKVDLLQNLLEAVLPSGGESEVEQNGSSPAVPSLIKVQKHMAADEVASNSSLIFLAGYDTTRLTLSYWAFLMGKHPDVQEKMRTEVMQAAQNGPLAYEDITGLVYTQQVLNETMRLHPAVVAFTTRRALEDYAYGDLLIRKGTSVLASTYQIHHDPMLWPEPDKFDPDRFSPENKASIPANAFLPFGVGPKHCLGQRLAQLELAFITARLLRRFRITLGPSQKPDMEYVTYAMLAAPKNGVWIKLQKLGA
ncbi:unnamed protein product [Ixodes pacificus]